MSQNNLEQALELCDLYAGTHRHDLLKEKALEVLAIAPNDHIGLYYLGLALNNLRQYEELKDTVERAIHLHPYFPHFYYFRYLYYLSRGGVEYIEALISIREAIRLDPLVATFHRSLGEIYLINWEPEKAYEALKEAVRLAPHDAEKRSRMALALLRCRKTKEAFQIAREALSDDPDDYDVYNNVGQVFLFGGALEEAEKLFREALRRHPTWEYFQKQLTNCLREQTDKKNRLRKNLRYTPLVFRQRGRQRFFDEEKIGAVG